MLNVFGVMWRLGAQDLGSKVFEVIQRLGVQVLGLRTI